MIFRPISTIAAILPAITMLAVVSACASRPAAPPPAGMQAAYSIDCSGSGLTWDDCYKKAQRACDGGYDVVSRSADTADGVKQDRYNTYGSNQVYRTLVVTCRKPAASS
jgi:hypothetical protein